MKDWQVGDRVQISDFKSPHFKKCGKMSRKGERGWYILLDGEEKEIFFPWGYDIPRGDAK